MRRALELGLELWGPGYNVFVAGPTGAGRRSTVAHMLERLPAPAIPRLDYAYGYNPEHPDQPLLLTFPAGQARRFERRLKELVAFLRDQYPQVLEDGEFQRERRLLYDRFARQEERLRGELIQQAVRRRFRIAGSESSQCWYATPRPLIDDQAITMKELEQLAEAGRVSPATLRRLRKAHGELNGLLERFLQEVRAAQKRLRRDLRQLFGLRIRQALRPSFAELAAHHEGPEVDRYLTGLARHIEATCAELLLQADQATVHPEETYELEESLESPPYHHFELQIVHESPEGAAPPIVRETRPTVTNLLGLVERGRADHDPVDQIRICAGSLLAADGGYLIVDAHELLSEEGTWQPLKRALLTGSLELHGHGGIKPQPIALRTKVILIGTQDCYQQLCDFDPDFGKVFKVLADFDHEMPVTPESVTDYLSVVSRIIGQEQLPCFDRQAMAAMVECGARMTGRADRLTACFSRVANLAREAAFWARKERQEQVGRRHVELAIQRMLDRHGQAGEKLREQIAEGFILLDLQGTRVGQVNALVVYEVGEHTYGAPCRITATAGPGEGPIHNIERMANLSGPSHDKGVLILGGFLRQRYASDKPLCLAASICFEQSYHEVDGDSASLGEAIALLSALAGLPVRQDLAVTGSINQHGEIQPVGEINAKIEGFFDVCRQAGLTGTQGVILPARNVPELMLRSDVVEAVRQKRFRLYGVNQVDEVLQLVTGQSPGIRNGNRMFQRGSVNARVDGLLGEFAEIVGSQKNGRNGSS